MGMSASQARFLGLTARKNNVEYEGQQVNQQRTTLSNESANYYSDLLGMSVPVPPSVDDYTKTVYSFNDGALTNTITSMIAQGNGKYKISYLSQWTDDFAVVAAPNAVVNNGDGYRVGAKVLRALGSDLPTDGVDEYYKSLSADEQAGLLKEEKALYNMLCKEYGPYETDDDGVATPKVWALDDDEEGPTDWQVRYVQNTTSGEWVPYFTKNSDLTSEDTIWDDNGNSLTYIPMYTIGAKLRTEEIKQVEVRTEQDSTGRIINITLHPDTENQVTYAVSTQTVTDQAKYDDAMNQYEYDKAKYDNAVQEINAKIKIIQNEDKNLEIRLKQLDTEQEAIQTEMDAVQKVIEKNTESSFKTFG